MKSRATKPKSSTASVKQSGVATATSKEPEIAVVERGACASLTKQSTLGYEVGRDTDANLHLRIVANSAPGKFSSSWVPLNSLMQALEKAKLPITCATFSSVLRKRSANNLGFVLAVFKHKGLVQPLPDKQRGYGLGPEFASGAKRHMTRTPDATAKPLKAKAAKAK